MAWSKREARAYTFMIYAFAAMVKVISRRERPSVHRDTPRSQQKNFNDRKCVFVFALMAAIFALCWLPYFTVMLVIYVNYYLKSDISVSIDEAAQAFGIIRYMTSISNPLLYTFFKRDFRLALRNRSLRRGSTSIPLESTSRLRSQSDLRSWKDSRRGLAAEDWKLRNHELWPQDYDTTARFRK